MFSIGYGADEHYKGQDGNGNPKYEQAKQVIAAARRLVNLYAFNRSGAVIYLKVQDSANAGTDKGDCTVYPVPPGDFLSVSTHGGDRFWNGVYLAGFTDSGCTMASGADLQFKVDWTAAV